MPAQVPRSLDKLVTLSSKLLVSAWRTSAPAHYTDTIPVVTAELMEQLKADRHVAVGLTPVRIGQDPTILFLSPDKKSRDRHALQVWRRALSPALHEFAQSATEILGKAAKFPLDSHLALDANGELIDKSRQRVSADRIAAAYTSAGISAGTAGAFADHYTRSLKDVLTQLPVGTALVQQVTKRTAYSRRAKPFLDRHEDFTRTLLMHLTDPGTPYLSQQKSSWGWWSTTTPLYRTQAGDVSLHGALTAHGHATAAPEKNGAKRNRFFLGYNVRLP